MRWTPRGGAGRVSEAVAPAVLMCPGLYPSRREYLQYAHAAQVAARGVAAAAAGGPETQR
eukprot:scaffold1117_cov379-Prasinococcus_capsulatus_cf.AAC.6